MGASFLLSETQVRMPEHLRSSDATDYVFPKWLKQDFWAHMLARTLLLPLKSKIFPFHDSRQHFVTEMF